MYTYMTKIQMVKKKQYNAYMKKLLHDSFNVIMHHMLP